ncbi:MAG: glycosyltransferase family 2 protein [Gammaproteobacteria bacterium]
MMASDDLGGDRASQSGPKVTLITVSYNSEHTIRDTIESVVEQDYPAIEYLIVDGASTDGTMDIVDRYRHQVAGIISEPDAGLYDAMNKGIARATGDVVAMINSDDVYARPTVISELVSEMERTSADIVFADLLMVDRDDLQSVRRYYDSSRFRPGRLRFGWMPAHPTMLVKRTLYERVGPFDLAYEIAADFEMVVRLFSVPGVTYAYRRSPVIRMRQGGVSTRGLKSSWTLNREIVRACRANGIWTALPLLGFKVPLKLLEFIQRPSEMVA